MKRGNILKSPAMFALSLSITKSNGMCIFIHKRSKYTRSWSHFVIKPIENTYIIDKVLRYCYCEKAFEIILLRKQHTELTVMLFLGDESNQQSIQRKRTERTAKLRKSRRQELGQPRPQGPLLSCAGNRDPWPIGFQGQFLLAVERQRHNNRKLK